MDMQTTQETDKYVSQRGTKFTIEKLPNGLFQIVMKAGGAVPDFCKGRYTSFRFAENDLVRYLRKGDKIGKAKYPDKA